MLGLQNPCLAAAASLQGSHTLSRWRPAPRGSTLGARMARPGAGPVLVAELMGHARLETTRVYTRPTPEDRVRALAPLPVDR